jgi:hypothetical protein
MFRQKVTWSSIILILARLAAAGAEEVPGVIISHIPSSSGVYVGSPGVTVLPNGDYLAKHDEFGPRSTEQGEAVTQVFRSADRGATWSHLATVRGMYWASIFTAGDDAYLMGTGRNHGSAVISRSSDDGGTWTRPTGRDLGLLLDDATPRQHDANYLTFHRFRRFQTLAMTDSVSGTRPGDGVWSAAEP